MKPGDKVKIKEQCCTMDCQKKYSSREGTIISDNYGIIRLDIDNGVWAWLPEMLELIEEVNQ